MTLVKLTVGSVPVESRPPMRAMEGGIGVPPAVGRKLKAEC